LQFQNISFKSRKTPEEEKSYNAEAFGSIASSSQSSVLRIATGVGEDGDRGVVLLHDEIASILELGTLNYY